MSTCITTNITFLITERRRTLTFLQVLFIRPVYAGKKLFISNGNVLFGDVLTGHRLFDWPRWKQAALVQLRWYSRCSDSRYRPFRSRRSPVRCAVSQAPPFQGTGPWSPRSPCCCRIFGRSTTCCHLAFTQRNTLYHWVIGHNPLGHNPPQVSGKAG